jgi:hypothetical protein
MTALDALLGCFTWYRCWRGGTWRSAMSVERYPQMDDNVGRLNIDTSPAAVEEVRRLLREGQEDELVDAREDARVLLRALADERDQLASDLDMWPTPRRRLYARR